MNRTLQRVLDITEFDRPLIVAVSGGKDSVSLLDMVMQFKKKFTILPEIVHFNHGLRPESKDEEEFIMSLGDEYGLEVKIFKFDIPFFKKEHKLSTEEAARKLRYRTLKEYSSAKKTVGNIYTAHTAGDQAETILFRIITGTGRTGLAGIRTHMKLDSGWIVKRPLLDITTEEIENYALKNKIKYVTDSSNFDLSIPRNYIRKNIIPSL
ncbi:MAG: tRNA lysidine(34) synthetase TilS, partial [Elusimicrobiota bacterium]|nr:tRNA lysidine(34) synthetase TilS [Elusimicrobiota bacterium]